MKNIIIEILNFKGIYNFYDVPLNSLKENQLLTILSKQYTITEIDEILEVINTLIVMNYTSSLERKKLLFTKIKKELSKC